ncbi:LysR substrate-binding domain-containing protein [Roseivirga misakiensis]|uniref:LysR family transcriptional regulator n=1 Tax=Roseivirga misakiensis TaxID=1563681 RepID=A0A1E5T227_9BACT|nr:LysR substrate-binding domain-containing protein [Roseivirga misakiensis]OEK05432.1 LysR family transcriptional regulator [Roseivirga misakiensis]
MTLQQLEYIVALDTHRHFVNAAESCFVTQPTLTLQIKKLETEMGTQIFDRSKHPIAPTKTGETVIESARQILREVNRLKEFVNTEKDDLSGTFRIGVIPTVAPYLMPLFLKSFTDANPKIKLIIREIESEQIIQDIKNDLLDIGILATPLDENSLREVPLYNEPFLVYAAEHHPLYQEKEIDATGLPVKGLWLLNQGHCLRNQVLNICSQRRNAQNNNLSYESGSIETLKNLVRNHTGYTLVPELAVRADDQTDKRVIRFKQPEPTREISLVVHQSFNKEALIEHFRAAILSHIPDHFKKAKTFNRIKWR